MIHTPFITSLVEKIEEKPLLKHPFYQLWAKGALPIEVLRAYAEQYYHLEKAFPTFLSRMHADCGEFAVRQAITDNLYDEEHGIENHRELWLRFGEAIGTTREVIQNSDLLPETRETIETFHKLAGSSFLEGTAALAAYESQIPAVAETKLQGLKEYYGITDIRGTAFFRVHSTLDKEHSEVWWNVIDKYATSRTLKIAVEKTVTEARDALFKFLDGICRVYLPTCLTQLATDR